MAPRITGFRSRADLRLRAPRSISKNINPGKGGVAVHYGGSTPNPAPANHDTCENIWRGWQNYHMDTHRWVDIAYTAGFCNHGYVLAGRGYGVRTAANGTNDANDRYYAFVWVGGGNAVPSPAAYDALEWLILDARKNGGAGDSVKPHNSFVGTGCPGTLLDAFTDKFDGKPVGSVNLPPASAIPQIPKAPTRPKEVPYPLPTRPRLHWYGRNDGTAYSHSGYQARDRDEIKLLQKALIRRGYNLGRYGADGYYGEKTEAAVRTFQRAKRILVDGKTGPQTWNLLNVYR